jgi:hypothetical protein
MKQATYILLTVILCCCMSFRKHKGDKNLAELKNMLHTKRNFDKAHVRFDGVYSLYEAGVYDKPMFFLEQFIGFYKNGMVLNSGYLFNDSLIAVDWVKKFMGCENTRENGYVGVFDVNKDTIDIICYNSYGIGNGGVGDFITHFRGIVYANEIYLKIIAPYPDVKPHNNGNMARNREIIDKSYVFYFKPFAAKTLIDSNNFWINKYKQ